MPAGTAHLHADPWAAADEEARLPLQLDDHLVPAAAIGHLDPGLLDRLPRDVVVAQRHELDLDARRVDGLDADLAAAQRHAQCDLAGRLEDGHADPSGRAGCRPADDPDAVGAMAGRAGALDVGKVDAAEE